MTILKISTGGLSNLVSLNQPTNVITLTSDTTRLSPPTPFLLSPTTQGSFISRAPNTAVFTVLPGSGATNVANADRKIKFVQSAVDDYSITIKKTTPSVNANVYLSMESALVEPSVAGNILFGISYNSTAAGLITILNTGELAVTTPGGVLPTKGATDVQFRIYRVGTVTKAAYSVDNGATFVDFRTYTNTTVSRVYPAIILTADNDNATVLSGTGFA